MPAALVGAKDTTKDGDPPSVGVERIEVEARPIAHFERARPEAKRFGALEFRGGHGALFPGQGFRRLVGPRYGA